MLTYLKLLAIILKQGRLDFAGEDYNKLRALTLQELREFIPEQTRFAIEAKKNRRLSKFKNLIGQIAFVKNSFKKNVNHITIEDLKLSYVRIPKAANTSASIMMLEKIYPALKSRKLSATQINFLTDANLQQTIDSQHTHFTIVRNPFARLISAYHDFFEQEKSNFIYDDYLFGIFKPDFSFTEFVNLLHRVPDALKDQHLKPQHLFLQPYKNQNINVKYFKLEEIEKINAFLNPRELQFPHFNKSQSSYTFEEYYSNQNLQIVYSIYKRDIEQFDYQKEYEALKQKVRIPK